MPIFARRLSRHAAALAALLSACAITPARADPPLADEVYEATITPGETEFEAHYAQKTGGVAAGENVLRIEAGHSFSQHFRLAWTSEFQNQSGSPLKPDEIGIEAIWGLGKLGPVNLAVYGEYSHGIGQPDQLETKLLVQHTDRLLDLRFNLIAAKPLAAAAPVALSYAARADVKTAGELRLGIEALGDLGTATRLLPRAAHYVGPSMQLGIEGLGREVVLSASYLAALDAARDQSKGLARLSLEVGL